IGTPHRVCRTFARFDFILVPLPAARITAKIGELSDMYSHHSYRSSTRRSRTTRSSAGAAGFEPAIPGPKPGAFPLGHAPVQARADFNGAQRTAEEDLYRSQRLLRQTLRQGASDLGVPDLGPARVGHDGGAGTRTVPTTFPRGRPGLCGLWRRDEP